VTGRLARIRRYPVKSLAGEDLERAALEPRGLAGDRAWAVRDLDGKLGSGKSTRRFRRMDGLLELAATYDGDTPLLTFPDGRVLPAGAAATDQALSAHVGRPVSLARESEVAHFDEGPVHLVTTASLRALADTAGHDVDPRRTRANLLVDWAGDGFPEHEWVGRQVAVGSAVVLHVTALMPRCVMVNLPQEDLPADPDLLRLIGENDPDVALGVVADVVRTGEVALGDDVTLLAGH
jgi:hypothetical protein